jgi:hypothetical protein
MPKLNAATHESLVRGNADGFSHQKPQLKRLRNRAHRIAYATGYLQEAQKSIWRMNEIALRFRVDLLLPCTCGSPRHLESCEREQSAIRQEALISQDIDEMLRELHDVLDGE